MRSLSDETRGRKRGPERGISGTMKSSSGGRRSLGDRLRKEKGASRRMRSSSQIVIGEGRAQAVMRGRVLLSAVANENDHVQDQEVISEKMSKSLFAAMRVVPGQDLEEGSGKMSRFLSAATKVVPGQNLEVASGKKTLPYGEARESGKGLVSDPVRNPEREITTILSSGMTNIKDDTRIKSSSGATRGRLLPNPNLNLNLYLSESRNPSEI